jgi:hypothetical protein
MTWDKIDHRLLECNESRFESSDSVVVELSAFSSRMLKIATTAFLARGGHGKLLLLRNRLKCEIPPPQVKWLTNKWLQTVLWASSSISMCQKKKKQKNWLRPWKFHGIFVDATFSFCQKRSFFFFSFRTIEMLLESHIIGLREVTYY